MFGDNSEKYKNFNIRNKFRENIEPQEIFLDNLSKKKEKEIGLSEKKLEVPLSKKSLQGLYFVFLVLIFILFAKTFQLQVVQGKDFSKLSRQNKVIVYSLQAQRGVIYDKDFNQLVFNKPNFSLICKKRELPQDEKKIKKVLTEISNIVGQDVGFLEEKIDNSNSPQFLISENLDYQELILLEVRKDEFPGFEVVNNMVREYKDGSYFSHLIGYQRETGEKSGLESFYDDFLKEKAEEFSVQRDAQGNLISKEIISLPEAGKSLVLWLDSELQKKIQTELEKTLRNVGSQKAAAVALNPKTGGVLALVSIPTFDNNLFSRGMSAEDWKEIVNNPNSPLFNRVISAGYPTGSTIKPLIACAALEEKIISAQNKINCQGEIVIDNPWYPDLPWEYHDWTIHGWTDIRKAIAQSCNVFFYTVGGGYKDINGLGVEKMKKYLELFNWGKKTNIDLPNELDGFIPDKEWKKSYFENKTDKIWMPGDDYNLSIGQGFLKVTPLQVATAFVSIANNGTLYEPKIVQKIVDKEKNIIKETEQKIIRENFISPENLRVVREGMRQAVTNGSATGWLDSLPVKVAAKTGTAQTSRKDYYHNWITVFAPYDDPEIVLTLVFEDVKGEMIAALPTARAILEWYFSQ